MMDTFILVVPYKKGERQFDAEFRKLGYSYKIAVNVDGMEILFEPDEERNYRAVLQDPQNNTSLPDVALIGAIVTALEAAFKD